MEICRKRQKESRDKYATAGIYIYFPYYRVLTEVIIPYSLTISLLTARIYDYLSFSQIYYREKSIRITI